MSAGQPSTYHFRCPDGHQFQLDLTAQQFIDGEHRCDCGKTAKRYVPLSDDAQNSITQSQEQTRRYRNQSNIESVKLPFHQPGADAYGPNGEQRFFTREAYVQAGRRNAMVWQ